MKLTLLIDLDFLADGPENVRQHDMVVAGI